MLRILLSILLLSVLTPRLATAASTEDTARMAQGDYTTLPENVETDQEGLRVEMVYAQ